MGAPLSGRREAVEGIAGIEASFTKAYENKFPPASPLVHLHFGDAAPLSAGDVVRALEAGEPSILVSGDTALSVGPQTLLDGEAEIIADRLHRILTT